ncbi:hypothetical protein BGX34_003579 [Mortierella sp. NVP85]|nr:hypothetical protein BGX34_003579 [Mortierella sp. NVP85]
MLSSCGKMKREDIRMAWREKVALCCIFFIPAIIIFVITGFGKLMCPGAEHIFSPREVGYHAALDDFYISLKGKVYGITKFAKNDHSNGHASYPSDTAYTLPFAGLDVTEYFPLQLNIACFGLVTSPSVSLIPPLVLKSTDYPPRIQPLVDHRKTTRVSGTGEHHGYLEKTAPGSTETILDQVFYLGKVDYRNSFQCQFTNYLLLSTSVALVSAIAIRFLAALHLGSIRVPEEHDKFVIIQLPCYTEGEDSLRKTIDSIKALRYDDKRKLLFVITDG